MKRLFSTIIIVTFSVLVTFGNVNISGSDDQGMPVELQALPSVSEPRLVLEPWMINSDPFTYQLESDVFLENWMIDLSVISLEADSRFERWMLEPVYNNSDPVLTITLEGWMISTEVFTNNDLLVLEDWMLKSPFKTEQGEQELTLEDWMFNFHR